MKKLALIGALSLSMIVSYGQGGAKWSVNGNAVSPSNFLGTTNARDLVLKTNMQERLRILSTGNIGIGLSSPSSMLSVGGTIESTTGGFKFPDGSVQSTAARLLGTQANPYNELYVQHFIKVGPNSIYIDGQPSSTAGVLDENHMYTSNALLNNDLYINCADGSFTNGGDPSANTILNAQLNSGMVGVGVAGPDAKLDVLIPSLATMESGLRVTLPFVLDAGATIDNLFHVRRLNPFTGLGFVSEFVVKTNGRVGISQFDPKSVVHIENNLHLISNSGSVGMARNAYFDGSGNWVRTLAGTAQQFYMVNSGDIYLRNAPTGAAGSPISWQNAIFINNDGKVGIGDGVPQSRLHLSNGMMTISGTAPNWNTWNTRITSPINSAWVTSTSNLDGDYMSFGMTETGWFFGLSPQPVGSTSAPDIKYAMSINKSGLMTAREIKVTLSGWSDFVFQDDYQLRTLSEVEQFVQENGHLPDVPSEKEVLENGSNLGEMDAVLLQKIEELTLYMIEQDRRLSELEVENEKLKARIAK